MAMSKESFRVDLLKEQLTFSAAHFITFGDNVCERLHGHNYGVRCEVVGDLEENGYVVDFIALRDAIAKVVGRLDHHVLLATEHKTIKVESSDAEVTATFENKRWIFPAEDCVLLPIANTAAELLAKYIAGQLIEQATWKTPNLSRLIVGVDENQGQWGVYEIGL